MVGAGAKQRHNDKRREKLKLHEWCQWKDGEGVWHPKPGFNRRGAQRAIERIYEMTLHQYEKYECEVCLMWHIRPHKTRWRASVLVQMVEEGEAQ